ncbi:helix-turn-helix domain-containing protein [Haloarcula salina]|uniref:ArsR family transcriptional regulator n=1 Tax=Haloarcula salina TaxID=1429914 RepID=A0AA41KG39_9EURY|nr:ArsR family transcriptional regulator [Haloarcula salina]MBV0900311.1 ArsR family transcriptional regulator [Haloarcula salina]
MSDARDQMRPFECENCDGVALANEPPRCCGEAMTPVEPTGAVTEPSLEALTRTVFEMSGSELEICLCVMEGGELTVAELAEQIEYDRSVVARHLNHLADLGVVEKRRRIRPAGGHVYVYTPRDPETVRARLREAFLSWVNLAAGQLDELGREKVEAIAESETGERRWRVFQEP